MNTNKFIKVATVVVMATIMTLGVSAFADTNSSYEYDSSSNSEAATYGWYQGNGYWYFNDYRGQPVKNCFYRISGNGAYSFDGYCCYCFDKDGRLITSGWARNERVNGYGETVVDWGYATNSGKLKTGWFMVNGKWYYADRIYGTIYQNGWYNIDNAYYRFDKSGAMVVDGSKGTGWVQIEWNRGYGNGNEKCWIYYTSKGVLADGWLKIDGAWYYFDGVMAQECTYINLDFSGNTYYFDKSGKMFTGWKYYYIEGQTYWRYFTSSGAAASGWKKIDGSWYYFGDYPIKITDQGTEYAWDEELVMYTGWHKIDGKWYYFNNSGAMQTGWKEIKGKWYYFNNSGAMQSNTTIDGYTLGADGAWIR